MTGERREMVGADLMRVLSLHPAAPSIGRAALLGCKALTPEACDFDGFADTPAEAARRMIEHRKLSAKINYNVLAGLFSDDPPPDEGDAAAAGAVVTCIVDLSNTAEMADLFSDAPRPDEGDAAAAGAVVCWNGTVFLPFISDELLRACGPGSLRATAWRGLRRGCRAHVHT